jgi:hypothetical protein
LTHRTANSGGSSGFSARIFCFRNNPVKYTDPDGREGRPAITGLSGVLPLAGKADTGNWIFDSLLAGSGSIWNTVASVINAPICYAGDLINAGDVALTSIDNLIPNEYSLTGSGLREDLFVGSLFAGMNPAMIAEGVQHTKNISTIIQSSTKNQTTVIGRVDDLKNLRSGERSLLDRLPNQGNPKANWKQNSGVLRQEMGRRLPIRDASPGNIKGQFLNAERNLLQDHGWKFDKKTNYWVPPGE